jgi:hypothetical protein
MVSGWADVGASAQLCISGTVKRLEGTCPDTRCAASGCAVAGRRSSPVVCALSHARRSAWQLQAGWNLAAPPLPARAGLGHPRSACLDWLGMETVFPPRQPFAARDNDQRPSAGARPRCRRVGLEDAPCF